MDRGRIAFSVVALLLFAASALVAAEFALMVAPVFFLLLLLFNGLRPGEQRILEYRRRYEAPASRRRAEPRRWAPRVVHRPGRLIASGLAMRPPPVAPFFSS